MKYDELLTNIEETLSRNSDVKKLLIDTCHIITESGNYSLSCIGLINDGTGRMESIPVAMAILQSHIEKIRFWLQ
jgi:hypothetical protein